VVLLFLGEVDCSFITGSFIYFHYNLEIATYTTRVEQKFQVQSGLILR
jgi:hypothetical protein